MKPSHGLTDDEIEQHAARPIEHAEEDVQARLLIDNRVEAQRILKATEKQLEGNGDLLLRRTSAADRGADDRAAKGRAQEPTTTPSTPRLRSSTGPARSSRSAWMDRGIERALKGHSVGEFDKGELSPHAQKAYAALQERTERSPPDQEEQGPERPVE